MGATAIERWHRGPAWDSIAPVIRPFAFVVTVALIAASMLARAPSVAAQDADAATSTLRSTAPAPSVVWASGPVPELWAAPAIGLGVGGLTLALAVVLGQVASANYHEATDPMTTQARAYDLSRTVPDLSLAANVLFAVGGGMAFLGAVWVIVLPFSQHTVPAEAPSQRASVRMSFGPGGLSIAGTF